MAQILTAVLIYVLVYGADHLLYVKQKGLYEYVSRRTYILFVAGQIALISLFFNEFKTFFEGLYTEVALIGLIFLILMGFAAILRSQGELVCNAASRTERCLTPGYVAVKGADILFQQLAYLIIAKGHFELFGTSLLTFVSFMIVLIVIHTPVILSTNREIALMLTLSLAALSAPFFYIYIVLGLFWPAVYVHALAYMFVWLGLANMEGKSVNVQKWGKAG